MPDPWRSCSTPESRTAIVRAAEIARRQFGVITAEQMRAAGAGGAVRKRWLERGILHRRYHGVYVFGPGILEGAGELAAALLRAGPGAMLAAATALWWMDLIQWEPSRITLITPRRVTEPQLHLIRSSSVPRSFHRELPVCAVSRALRDYAAEASVKQVGMALSNALYHELTTVRRVGSELGQGRLGAPTLREALEVHHGGRVRTRAQTEIEFLAFCRRYGIPKPTVNAVIEDEEVDFSWAQPRLIVEMDGPHHDRDEFARVDRRRDMKLRAAGWSILRYDPDLLGAAAAAEILTLLPELRRS